MTGVPSFSYTETCDNTKYSNGHYHDNILKLPGYIWLHRDNSTTIIQDLKTSLLNELEELSFEYSTPNGDNNWKPLNKVSYEYSKLFLELMPNNLMLPDLVPEPTGYIGFEWTTINKNFILSIDENKKLIYAYLDKDGQRSATLNFNDAINI